MPEKDATRWGKSFANIVDIAQDVLRQHGVPTKASLDIGLELALQISEREGGGQYYLPKGDDVRRFLRDERIWQEFNGHNLAALARQHNLTDVRIYQIIEEQRKLHVKRVQSDLFPQNKTA